MMRFFSIAGSAAHLLLVLLSVHVSAEELCVTLASTTQMQSYPAAAGDVLTIAFTHSIYGSRIEERFQVNGGSFEPVDIRYSELRLVEFYGFESAARDGAWWVARPARRHYPSLALRATQDSPIRISFREHTFLLSDEAARASLEPCQHKLSMPRGNLRQDVGRGVSLKESGHRYRVSGFWFLVSSF
jgi:hypothetical protein